MLTFLKILIKVNPWKIIMMFFFLVSASILLFLNDHKSPITEVTEYPVGFDNDQIILIYTGESGTSSVTRGWKVKERYSTDVIRGNKLVITDHDYDYQTAIITLLVVSGVLLGIFIIICIVEMTGGEDGGLFNLDFVYHHYFYQKMEVSQDGDYYYYSIGDRLINKDKSPTNDCYHELHRYTKNKKLFPKWEGTTQEKRDQKLNQILK